MSKFIDADLLRKEIEKRLKNIRDYMTGTGMRYKGPKYFKAQGKESAYDALLSIIDSLQQEQPFLPSNLDDAAEEYAYNNWEDNDYHTGASEGLPFDAIGHIEKCFKAGAEWMARQMKQGQPPMGYDEAYINECIAKASKTWKGVDVDKFIDKMRGRETVDLEEDVKKYFGGLWPGIETPEQCNTDMHFTPPAIMRLVKYAYELGFNARKEE